MKVLAKLIIPKLPAAPVSPVAGEIYYNTADGETYQYNGVTAAWIAMTGLGDAHVVAAGIVKITTGFIPPTGPHSGDLWIDTN